MINRYNRNECHDAFLIAKNPHLSAVRREAAAHEFCVALWYSANPDNADTNMIDAIVPYLAVCAHSCADEDELEIISNGMRNSYYNGYKDGYATGFSVAEDEERG